jgi:glucans biosynthesis protein
LIARLLPVLAAFLGAASAQAQTFGYDQVVAQAQAMAAAPYVSHLGKAGAFYQGLNYDQYRDIRFVKDHALWHDAGLPFQIEFFHPGQFNPQTVAINEIVNGTVVPVPFRNEDFDYGHVVIPKGTPPPDGYAGFRIHYPINNPQYKDEFLVFLGASYFRAVGQGQPYGLSARGLALNTAQPDPEEFPSFEQFWLVRPAADATSLTVYALLNSPSVAGAYRFVITPGKDTMLDVAATLFFRKAVALIGIAPLTSMYWFGENSASHPYDWRPEVHDSDGLLIGLHAPLWQWRPLDVTSQIRHVAFQSDGLEGFGLLQRDRSFAGYLDFEARYHQRPSAWVEPTADWGSGSVHLVELPTPDETNDNIVAFWTPSAPPPLGQPWVWKYRLHFQDEAPEPSNLSRVTSTRRGHPYQSDDSYFVLEFSPVLGANLTTRPEPEVSAGDGALLREYHIMPNPDTGGWRVSLRFQLKPETKASDLKCQLFLHGVPVSEQWNYLWSSPP